MSLFKNKSDIFFRDNELEAFYDTDIISKRFIILAHAILYLLPVILAFIIFHPISGHYMYYIIVLFVALLYVTVIFEAVSYMNERLRKFYKKHLLTIILPFFVPIGALVGYASYDLTSRVSSDAGLGDFLAISFLHVVMGFFGILISFFLVQIGMSYLFKASRALYTQKASMEADMRFATEVQERILKDVSIQTKDVSGYACSIPASELGGDYFELINQKEHIIASVGDISGHSFGAGLLMTMMKSALHTHLRYVQNPATVLAELNTMLLNQSDRSMYATMSMISLDVAKNKALLSNAGHHPLLHYDAKQDTLKKLLPKGIGLGMTGKASYVNMECSFSRGDVLILYTDGLVETRDENNDIRESDFFENMVLRILREKTDSPKAIADTLIRETKAAHYGELMEDDASLIVLKIE